MSDNSPEYWTRQDALEKWEELSSRESSDVWGDIHDFMAAIEANLPDANDLQSPVTLDWNWEPYTADQSGRHEVIVVWGGIYGSPDATRHFASFEGGEWRFCDPDKSKIETHGSRVVAYRSAELDRETTETAFRRVYKRHEVVEFRVRPVQ